MGVRLTLCLDDSGRCVPPPAGFNVGLPASVTSASMNFPEEAFYWYADARITRPGGGNVRLTVTKEGAFSTGKAAVGKQITFDRVRVTIDQLTAGATYTITHPFGVITAVADELGDVVINTILPSQGTATRQASRPAPLKRGGGGGGGGGGGVGTA